MKNVLIKNRVKALLGAAIIFCALPNESNAQEKITAFHPVAGFPGDTIMVTGVGVDRVTKVSLGELEATLIANSSTKLSFVIPAGASTAGISFTNPDSTVTKGKILIPERKSPFEKMIMFEAFETPLVPNGGAGQTIAQFSAGNSELDVPSYFTNDDLTFTGTGIIQWQQGGPRTYQGASNQFSVLLTTGQEFVIKDIKTLGYENIRLAFGINNWFSQVQGGLKAEFSIDGGTTWEGVSPYYIYSVNGGGGVYVRMPKQLPAVASLALKFSFNNAQSQLGVAIDDVQLTGFPAGIASINSFDPPKQKINKEVKINGKNFGDVTGVKFAGPEGTKISAVDFTAEAGGALVTVKVPVGAVTGIVSVVTGGNDVPALDNFEILPSKPEVTAYVPPAAPNGGLIILEGKNLYELTDVTFNGVVTTEVYYVNDTIAEVYVPASATSGPVHVETAQGKFESDFVPVIEDGQDGVLIDKAARIAEVGDFTVDNTVPKITFSLSSAEGNEKEQTEIMVKAMLDKAASDAVKVTMAIGGENITVEDYTLSASEVTIPTGALESAEATLKIAADNDTFEAQETLEVSMKSADGSAVIGKPRMQSVEILVLLSAKDENTGDRVLVYQTAEGVMINLANDNGLSNAQLAIYDLNGRKQFASNYAKMDKQTTLYLGNQLKSGVYILKIGSGSEQFAKKFIIKN